MGGHTSFAQRVSLVESCSRTMGRYFCYRKLAMLLLFVFSGVGGTLLDLYLTGDWIVSQPVTHSSLLLGRPIDPPPEERKGDRTCALAANGESGCPTLTFGVLGDWGAPRPPWAEAQSNAIEQQLIVADALGNWAEQKRPNLMLSVGDHAYPSGLAGPEQHDRLRASWADVYTGGNLDAIPWYATPGKHDCIGDIEAQFDYNHPRWMMKNAYGDVDLPIPGSNFGVSVRLFTLDMCSWLCGAGATNNLAEAHCQAQDGLGPVRGMSSGRHKMIQWLDNRLEEANCGHLKVWCIVAGHWPIFSLSGHGPTHILMEELLPILRIRGVHAYFSGNEHNLQCDFFCILRCSLQRALGSLCCCCVGICHSA